MAKNPQPSGSRHRLGSVDQRTQFEHQGTWRKRDTETGRIVSGSSKPYVGVAKEVDERWGKK